LAGEMITPEQGAGRKFEQSLYFLENSTEQIVTPSAEPVSKTTTPEPEEVAASSEVEATEGNNNKPKPKRAPAPEIKRRVPEVEPRAPIELTLQSLLRAGSHFGHQTARWHPKMAPFIYGSRNGIHIINLPITLQKWEEARKAIVDVVSRGGNILFVGTKRQAQRAVETEATRCGSFYVSQRWLGGMITNFQTIRQSIERLKNIEGLLSDEEKRAKFTKKELLMMDRDREKLEFSLGGIRDMHAPPQLLFVIDTKRESIAVNEAKRLDIPVVALVDTNCDPGEIEHAIPSNDDASRVISLFCGAVADAVNEAREIYKSRRRSLEDEQASDNVEVVQRGASQEQDSAKADNAKSDAAPAKDASSKKSETAEKPQG